jgi:hypothetical protein
MNSFLWRLGRQLLYHARHDIYQLLFVRIQAPKDGSMLALCERLYEELRKAATCTRLPMPYGFRSPRTVNEYVAAIELFATKLNVGLIVIEELQHMYLNQMHADQGAMRLLTNVISTMHIPILFIGTWPAASLLSVEVRLGRRATGPVVAFFRRMQNDEEFEAFLTALFHFQFTTGVTAIDAGLVQAFHKHTQGIADLVVKLFAICQLELISMDEGVFDVALVERLGEQEMVLICPAVRALREGRNENDSKLWDLEPVDLHDYLKAYADRVTLQTAISSRRGARGLRRRIETHVTATAVANALLAASEIPPEAAAAIATSQVERNPDDSTTESVRKILNRVSEGARGPRPTRSRDQRKQDRTDEAFATLDDDDARKVVYLAARDKRNVPDALAEKGYVCGLLDDVPL